MLAKEIFEQGISAETEDLEGTLQTTESSLPSQIITLCNLS